MAFVDQKSLQERSAGVAGAIIFPAALGAIFISGLAVTEFVPPAIEHPPTTFNVPEEVPPPPPEEKIEPKPQPETAQSTVVAPKPPIEFTVPEFTVKPIEKLPPIGGETIQIVDPIGSGTVPTLASIEPAIAKPRNDPGAWVTTSDYRPSWINRGWTGTARFELQVSARGRVNDCQITRSTGHPVLDRATCELVTKRARFKPATDSAGQAISGTYSNAVLWKLPD